MLLLWHEALGSNDEEATDDERRARVLYFYNDNNDDAKLLPSLQLVQGLLAFVRTLRGKDSAKGTDVETTAWIPEWTSATLSRRKVFILELEPQIFMALGVHPRDKIDHRAGYKALLREIYGMFRLFHGSIDSNLRFLLPSSGRSVASDTTYKKEFDGMDHLMHIAAVRKQLRKFRLAIDAHTRNQAFDDTGRVTDLLHGDDKLAQLSEAERAAEAELEVLVVRSPALLLHKKCALFFPTLLHSLDIRGSSSLLELQGISHFLMDELTFLLLQTFVSGFQTEPQFFKHGMGTSSVKSMALFFKGNLLWSSMETSMLHLLHKFLWLREERGMTMLHDNVHRDLGELHRDQTSKSSNDPELWMSNAYNDTFNPVWSSKLSYTECDAVAQSEDGCPRIRKTARSLHNQHPVSLSTFLRGAPPRSSGNRVVAPAAASGSGVAAIAAQYGVPSQLPASLSRFEKLRCNEVGPVMFKNAVNARTRSKSCQNAGLMMKDGYYAKMPFKNLESASERDWSDIESIWSPVIFPHDRMSTSATATSVPEKQCVAIWHDSDLTMITLLGLDETDLGSASAASSLLQVTALEDVVDYLEDQQRFRNLAQLILTQHEATFAPGKNIPTVHPSPPFLYINRIDRAFRVHNVPRLLKGREDDVFPIPDKLLAHYFPTSTMALMNALHAELHLPWSSGNRELCVHTRCSGWIYAKKSESSHREIYVFFDSKNIPSIHDLSDALQRLLDDHFGHVLL
uniref:CCZ1/INTU/HSP4 first Longin domain-containing protein n=1 Tax=Peronospora matthiolae TaxID=2874970 RepID=A0AAV1TM33_9STRA